MVPHEQFKEFPFTTGEAAVLVLTRKKNEKIVIGDNITLTVVEIRGDVVRLGIDAPKDVPVHRQEVHDAIREAQRREHEAEG